MPAFGLFLLDNTVLTNFSLVNREDLVLNLWGHRCATTTAVLNEYQVGVEGRKLPSDKWENLSRIELVPEELEFAKNLSPSLGAGESSCIVAAIHRNGILVSDDADARREAKKYGLPVTGSIGILVLNVRQANLTLEQGNIILKEWNALGYYAPVTKLDDLI